MNNLTDIVSRLQNTFDTGSSVANFFALSYWQSIVGFCFLILTIGILIYSWIKWGEMKTIGLGFIIGGFGMFMFSMMWEYAPPSIGADPSWEFEVISWFDLVINTFFGLLVFIIPFYIFTSLIRILNFRESKVVGKTYLSTVAGLTGLRLVGLGVALALLPLIQYFASITPDFITPGLDPFSNLTNPLTESLEDANVPGIIGGWIPFSFAIFSSIETIVAVVTVGIIFGYIVKYLRKKENITGEKTLAFFDHASVLMKVYLRWILKLVPFVIATKLATLTLGDDIAIFFNFSWLIVLFFIGLTLILLINIIVSILAMKGKNRARRYFKNMPYLWLNTFVNHSNIASTPFTKVTAKNLGACEEVSTLVSSVGSFAGLIMCSSFFPAMIVLFSLASTGQVNPVTITTAFVIIFMVSIGSTGSGAVDIIVLATALGALGFTSLETANIVSVATILLIFLESFNILGNATTHISIVLLVERYHEKINHGKGKGNQDHVNSKKVAKKIEHEKLSGDDENISFIKKVYNLN